MKKVDKISINIIDASIIDFSVLSDVVYTLKGVEFSSDDKIKSININLEISDGRIQFELHTLNHNEWGGVSPKRVSYLIGADDIDEAIDLMVEEYEEWFKLTDRQAKPRIKMPMRIKNGKLVDPIMEFIQSVNKRAKDLK